ncbi:MAG TPA: D-alanyl-D-alanine carboxypeptidase family protein [Gaiella sp.]|nr:D-alanyl-D-alanine carboxypeptidase family protein [Gaiella sp.]
MKRWGSIAVAAVALVASGSAVASAPVVSSASYLVQSSVDGRTLAARESDAPRPMASLTKLMTALVALERLPIDATVTVPPNAARIGESTLDLQAGERVAVRDLVIGTLVPSANDAATALAIRAGGTVERFVALMNARARQLGLKRTHYRNPHGLDEPGHVSSAADSAVLLRAALEVPIIRRYAGAARATLSNGRVVESTDHLIGVVPGFVGGKTGHTARAGWSQVAFARVGGVGITAAVLGAPSAAQRDRDLAALLRFGLSSYRPAKVVDPARTYAEVPLGWGLEPLALVAPRAVVRPTPTGRPLVEQVVAPAVASLPVRAGQRLGTLVVRDGSRVVARSPLVASRSEQMPSLAEKSRWVAGRAVDRLVGLVS